MTFAPAGRERTRPVASGDGADGGPLSYVVVGGSTLAEDAGALWMGALATSALGSGAAS